MSDDEVKYPHIEVQLTGEDGNAFNIMAKVLRALKQHKVPFTKRHKYEVEAMQGSYDDLLSTTRKWVTVK